MPLPARQRPPRGLDTPASRLAPRARRCLRRWPLAALLALCAPATELACAAPSVPVVTGLRLELVASGLDKPVQVASLPGDPRLIVVEQTGRIRILANGRLKDLPFLDLREQVSRGYERGLLSLAFHPRYAHNGWVYVDYTDRNGDTRVERYHVSSDPDRVDPRSATLILKVKQPYANHNGGLVTFGPDGMLYVGLGDGGSENDPHHYGEDLGTLLSKILRIDVDHGHPYAIPSDNPFVHRPGARPEIWQNGLRNPWRFAFDAQGGMLYIADVGQDTWEEVDVVPAHRGGLDFGWSRMEGRHCFRPRNCDTAGLTLPVVEYRHDEGCSITGGLVYRGKRLSPSFAGQYFYADLCSGFVRSFRWDGGGVVEHRQWDVGVHPEATSFGEDGEGELYLASLGGQIYRLVEAPRDASSAGKP